MNDIKRKLGQSLSSNPVMKWESILETCFEGKVMEKRGDWRAIENNSNAFYALEMPLDRVSDYDRKVMYCLKVLERFDLALSRTAIFYEKEEGFWYKLTLHRSNDAEILRYRYVQYLPLKNQKYFSVVHCLDKNEEEKRSFVDDSSETEWHCYYCLVEAVAENLREGIPLRRIKYGTVNQREVFLLRDNYRYRPIYCEEIRFKERQE